ncbi:hypothetical protein R1flu_003243 [Riccia fluitans]|uniref:HTH OST-type domain-containing protein n=1 Tax=Riccia fluitans TaxID=41844 RepID=A0ABD1Y8F7_9MARC
MVSLQDDERPGEGTEKSCGLSDRRNCWLQAIWCIHEIMFCGYERGSLHQRRMRTTVSPTKETVSSRREGNGLIRSQQQLQQQQQQQAHQQISLSGPLAILWDIENCPVPSEVKAEDVAGNIRMALRLHPAIEGAVTLFSAYGDFNHFPRKVREGCQRTGVNLIDVPNGKKDASDKAILVDLFLFALDNPPPCTIFLISGDVDFAPALHKLGQRGYSVVLAIPSGIPVSSALCSAGRFVWYWPSLARGEGLVSVKPFTNRGGADDRILDTSPPSGQVGAPRSPGDDSDHTSDEVIVGEEKIVWKSQREELVTDSSALSRLVPSTVYGSMSVQVTQACAVGPMPVYWGENISTPGNFLPGFNAGPHISGYEKPRQVSVAKELTNTGARDGTARNASDSVESDGRGSATVGNLQNLREQLVKLLNLHGGKLELVRVPPEYSKYYGKPLFLADYGYTKLVPLLEKMKEFMFIKGEGSHKTLHLTKVRSRSGGKSKRDKIARAAASEVETEVATAEKVLSDDSTYADNEAVCEDEVPARPAKDAERFTEVSEGTPKIIEADLLLDVEAQIPAYGWRYDSGDDKPADSQEEEEKDVIVDDSGGESTTDETRNSEEDFSPKGSPGVDDRCYEIRLQMFKRELQELLVSHAYKICMATFLPLYEQRYSRPLNSPSFGVQGLEALIEKVGDVAIVTEDPDNKIKYLVPNCGSGSNSLQRDILATFEENLVSPVSSRVEIRRMEAVFAVEIPMDGLSTAFSFFTGSVKSPERKACCFLLASFAFCATSWVSRSEASLNNSTLKILVW